MSFRGLERSEGAAGHQLQSLPFAVLTANPLSVCIILLLVSSIAVAEADAPPRHYLNLGPHFVFAPGFGSIVEYQDLLLKNAASVRVGATATYRGFSTSGVVDQSIKYSSTRAADISATYSHKIPYIDIHLGFDYVEIDGLFADQCTAAILAGSTNSLDSTKVDLNFQDDFSGQCKAASFGVAQQIWKRGPTQLDLRASISNNQMDNLSASGWSIRVLGRWQLESSQSIHYHVGYIKSTLTQGNQNSNPAGAAIGVNYVWEYR